VGQGEGGRRVDSRELKVESSSVFGFWRFVLVACGVDYTCARVTPLRSLLVAPVGMTGKASRQSTVEGRKWLRVGLALRSLGSG
jgi:hypothetical protein